MIVDLHTHYVLDIASLKPRLREDMTNCGIDPAAWVHAEAEYLAATAEANRAVAFGLRAQATGWDIPNASVAEFVRRHSDKYLYFTSIDPLDVDSMDQLKHEHTKNGAKGLKLAPIYQNVHPLDEKYLPMYAYCQRRGLPILFHMGTTFSSGVPIDYARPSYIDEIACRYPELKMVIAHIAHPWESEALAVIRRNRNVYADVSALYYRPWQFYNSMRLAVEYCCAHKLLFGSDFPATTTGGSIKGVMGVNDIIKPAGLPTIPEEILQSIVHADSLALLGIEEKGGTQ